jgi:hypothetical protein
MKILKGRVDWMEGRGNRPNLYLLVDAVPCVDDLRYHATDDGIYFAELGGFCKFYSWRGGKGHGFGGDHFPITLVDGEKRVLQGPWSSSSSTVNEHGFGPCIEAAYTTNSDVFMKGNGFRHCAVLTSLLRTYARVIDVGTGYTWRPGTSYAAGVAFPEDSEFMLACTGHVTRRGRDTRDDRFWSLPEILPDGVRVENVQAAMRAAIAANEHGFAREIADRYVRYLDRNAFDVLMSLSGYEPAVKLPDGSFWTKPA